MAGFGNLGPRNETLPKAVMAGCDMIIAEDAQLDYEILMNSIEAGGLSQERVDQAVLHILSFKASIKLHTDTPSIRTIDAITYLHTDEHKTWSRDAAEKSIERG